MKNKNILLVLALVAATMFSCKKDYTCACSKVYVTSSGSTSIDDGSYIFRDNKVSATDKCNQQETTGTDIFGNYSVQCAIK